MNIDPDKINYVAVGIGFVVWMLAMACIWHPFVQKKADAASKSDYIAFLQWRHRTGRVEASPAEYIDSPGTQSFSLSAEEWSLALTAAALLALCLALIHWGALY